MVEVKIPRPGESINEVVLSKWFFKDGDFVKKDQEVAEIESDKATLPIIAPVSGKLIIKINAGTTVPVNEIACMIDETAVNITISDDSKPVTSSKNIDDKSSSKSELEVDAQKAVIEQKSEESTSGNHQEIKVSPLARQLMMEHNLTVEDVINGLRRIRKEDVEAVIQFQQSNYKAQKEPISANATDSYRQHVREPMSQLRKKLSKRLVAVKNETAMLTTFNEVDMSAVIHLRNTYQKAFTEKHGIKLGFMSFFTMAATIALQKFPKVNSQIDGDDLVYFNYVDIGIAVQTEKGLMVPVLRNTEKMGLAEIEKEIANLAAKARSNRLSIEEMTGGTFTITNGGVFGSLFSTPIINPPQAAILGMHNIVERPVAINGKVEIRPMMYIALSYDHRIIDGKDSVSFLVKIKELIENPSLMLINGDSVAERLLDL